MLEGVVFGDVFHLFGCQLSEGAARSGEDNLVDGVVPLAYQALEDGRVLRVDGNNGGVVFERELFDEVARHNQGLLVGQGYGLVNLDGADGRSQPRVAHHGGNHDVDGGSLDDLGYGLVAGIDLDGILLQGLFQPGVVGLVGNDYRVGVESFGLFDKQLYVVVGCQGIYFEQVGIFGNHVQSLGTDRACRT